jgi:nicotinate-nucleotide pyrophosphorylase (carboxylating)
MRRRSSDYSTPELVSIG